MALMAMECASGDRAKEVKEFDESKIGVKGLVDSGITTIPRFFIHPPHKLGTGVVLRPPEQSIHHQIPTIDLSELCDSPAARSRIVERIRDASARFGFFQILNHGVPVPVLEATISAVKAFHELPSEARKPHYDRREKGGVTYSTSIDLFRAEAAAWRDTLRVNTAPVSPDWDRVPAICRRELMQWDAEMQKLSQVLFELLWEGLGLRSPGRLKECLEFRQILGHCYPRCPQPELTLGIGAHTDPLPLTILLQSAREGLQVKVGDEYWVDVEPVHGALVVNIGDFLQMISNGLYKSVEHRVVPSSDEDPRVSVATFISPPTTGESSRRLYGPLPEILSGVPKQPARYRSFTMEELTAVFFSKEISSVVDHFKI